MSCIINRKHIVEHILVGWKQTEQFELHAKHHVPNTVSHPEHAIPMEKHGSDSIMLMGCFSSAWKGLKKIWKALN